MVKAPAGAVRAGMALTSKKSSLFAQLGELDELESGNEHLGDIADIIQELMRCPEKIKACKRVTLSFFCGKRVFFNLTHVHAISGTEYFRFECG